jgi:hypothetical protein
MALDPAKYFIIVPNMLGNGLSSSPSNTPPPYDRSRFPKPESTAPEFLTGLGGGWAGRRILVCGLMASSGRPCRLV